MHRASSQLGMALFISALAAQTPTFRISSRLVQVNVIATDKNGPVAGLAKSDFTLSDDGKKQDIAFFDVTSRGKTPPPASSKPLPPNEFGNRPTGTAEQGNAILVVWDLLNTNFVDMMRARPAVLKSLRVIHPGDYVGVLILGETIGMVQDFTSDSSQLGAALDKYTKWPFIGYLPGEERAELTARAAWEIKNRLARVPGRKSVVWITGSSSVGLFGADFAVYIVDARGLEGFPEIRAEGSPDPMAFNWNEADGSVRTARLAGPAPWGANTEDRERMRMTAESTGGALFTYSNDIRGAIDHALTDGDLTYTLGFYVDDSEKKAEPYHTLKVEVKRSGVDLHYRQNYQSAPYEPHPERRIADALASTIDAVGIEIRTAIEKDGGNLRAPITVAIADLDLPESGGRHSGSVDCVLSQRSADGKELDRITRMIEVSLNNERYQAALKEGIHATVTLEPKPGLSELKIVVMDHTSGHIGSLTVPVTP